MSGDRPPGGANRGWGGDRLVVRGERVENLVVDPAVDRGEGQAVGGEPAGVGADDAFDQPVAAQPGLDGLRRSLARDPNIHRTNEFSPHSFYRGGVYGNPIPGRGRSSLGAGRWGWRLTTCSGKARQRLVTASVLTVLATAIGGCSSGPARASHPLTAAPVSPSPAAPRVPQLTGRQLSAVLLPEQDFPGYTMDTKNSTDSGTIVYANSQWTLTGMDCAAFEEQFPGAGFGETAYAQRVFATHTEAYLIETIYQFGSPSAATSFFSGVRGVAGACRSFTDSPQGGPPEHWALRLSTAPPGIGGRAYTIQENMSEVVKGITVNLAPVDLLAMHGVDVCEVTYSGDGPPATPSLASVAERLITRLSA